MKPILFNTEMVKAILEGRKTVTRRVVKPRPPCELRKMPEGYHAGEWHLYSENPLIDKVNHSPWGAQFFPPFQPDDILWVRETWARLKRSDGTERFVYKASDTYPFGESGYIVKFRWHPSIHMPKEAARIFLRVTDVRVEQLNEITADGVLNEGVGHWISPPPICTKDGPSEEEKAKYLALPKEKQEAYIQTLARHTYMGWCDYADRLFREWEKVWDSTIKPAELGSYGWAANPWVWVIEFERCEKPEAE